MQLYAAVFMRYTYRDDENIRLSLSVGPKNVPFLVDFLTFTRTRLNLWFRIQSEEKLIFRKMYKCQIMIPNRLYEFQKKLCQNIRFFLSSLSHSFDQNW